MCQVLPSLATVQCPAQTMIPFGHDHLKRLRRQDAEKSYHEDGSIYIVKPDVLRVNKNRLGGKFSMFETRPSWKMHQIDTLEDLELCEYLMKKNILNAQDFK